MAPPGMSNLYDLVLKFVECDVSLCFIPEYQCVRKAVHT